jgi:ribosomal protein S18 acetylase RimI-like enzyme
MNQLSIKIRELRVSDTRPFEELMYEAVYNPDPSNPYPREIIHEPRVAIYWKNWGFGEMDRCLVATIGGKIAGAVWCRLLNGDPKGFGYVDDKSPELTIALFPEYRGQGIGTMLLRKLVQQATLDGFKGLSISVTKGNPALKLYAREGFSIVDDNEYDFILYKSLQS